MKISSSKASLFLLMSVICTFYHGQGFQIDSLQATARQYLWKSDVNNTEALLIKGKSLLRFPSDLARRQVKSDDAQFQLIPESIFNTFIQGNNTYLSPGIQLAIVKNSAGPYYLLNGTQRWPITPQNFDKYGFDKNKVLNAEPSFIYNFALGQTI